MREGLIDDFTELYLRSIVATFGQIVDSIKFFGYGLKVSQTRLPKISAEYDFTTNTFISDDYSVIFNDNIIITIDGELYTFSYEEFIKK